MFELITRKHESVIDTIKDPSLKTRFGRFSTTTSGGYFRLTECSFGYACAEAERLDMRPVLMPLCLSHLGLALALYARGSFPRVKLELGGIVQRLGAPG